jgi:hypothetical protein
MGSNIRQLQYKIPKSNQNISKYNRAGIVSQSRAAVVVWHLNKTVHHYSNLKIFQ